MQSGAESLKARPKRSGLLSLQGVFAFVIIVSVSVTLSITLIPSSSETFDASEVTRKHLDNFKAGGGRPQNSGPKHGTVGTKNDAIIAKKTQQPDKDIEYYVIFSTGCTLQQHWESYVFFYHAFKVGQPGKITRIASGCKPDERAQLRKFHKEKIATMSDRFHVHFTPEYSRAGIPKDYKYNNKPNGVYHWMVNVLHMDRKNHSAAIENDIIILMDPDMILLRPLLHDFSGQNILYANRTPKTKVVRQGMPMAQQDGYLSNEWTHFNVSYITQGGKLPVFGANDPQVFYNSGPPYLATVRDMWDMVTLWKEYVPRVYEGYPKLFAEMYGLIIAKTQLNLPHTLVKSIVVSNTETDGREGWALVDALPGDQVCSSWDSPNLPIVLHYCGRYMVEKFFISKYRLKKKYISCEIPLLTPPPKDLATRWDYAVRPPPDRGASHEMEIYNYTRARAKREAFMVCGLIKSLNEASTYYKRQHCGDRGNYNETYNFHDDPYSLR